jgi:hypothetical protein
MHMSVFRIVVVIALLTGPAYAQQVPQLNAIEDWSGTKQKEKDAAVAKEKAYQESLKKIPDAKTSADPWGVVRAGDAAKTSTSKISNSKISNSKAATSVKPPTKTGADAD